MLKTLAGIGVGVFITQEYPNEIPRIKPLIQTFIKDIQTQSVQVIIHPNNNDHISNNNNDKKNKD